MWRERRDRVVRTLHNTLALNSKEITNEINDHERCEQDFHSIASIDSRQRNLCQPLKDRKSSLRSPNITCFLMNWIDGRWCCYNWVSSLDIFDECCNDLHGILSFVNETASHAKRTETILMKRRASEGRGGNNYFFVNRTSWMVTSQSWTWGVYCWEPWVPRIHERRGICLHIRSLLFHQIDDTVPVTRQSKHN